VEELRAAQVPARLSDAGDGGLQADEAVGRRVGKRPQDGVAEEGGARRRRPDPERQRGHRRERESRLAQRQPERGAQVRGHLAQAGAAHGPAPLLDRLHVAEGAQRLRARPVRRHACAL
jgi:hypothetical protein